MRHATEPEYAPTRTLCGRAADTCTIDNADPKCGTCLRVIRSRCDEHNLRRCKVCAR